ncbi:MAG: thioesterase family protein [Alphaproteobacteria bacterium]|nr:thioesterase family protein [Alphaproteobacteria bacterium]
MTIYRTQRRISFADCDPAGIVFHPRYLEMINAVIEDWFADALGKSFAELHMRERKGVPTVQISTEFPAPGRVGDDLVFTLRVTKLGNASIGLAIDGTRDGELLIKSQLTLVYMDLESARSEPLPDDLRTAISNYLVSSGENE